ncbi:hypothetical protein TRFO_37777 [Tritrichomonas foetus]|uniref:Uncharacterized protein n=1 Tax=Tritrichomonas foetus TaxID=1144522 RepID=A0A1J4JA95_9EUKA|nr:hypothetical protein TRFO_37777 [Tritrichomonas foetus]|eukprot:OHS96080.1 hypothetical protein TRFO_37777 [Tritrichomonas foetus]
MVKINSDRYSNKPSCKLSFTSLYYHENVKDIKTSFENFDTENYVPGNLYYICGFQDVDLQKLNPGWKEIGSRTRVLFNLGAPGQFCRGDHQPHDAGTELYSHSVDSIVKSEAKLLPQVGDGEKRRILLPKGHYQIFVGDCDLSIESTDLAYIEIFATSEKKHFKADVQGPVIVGGETTTADFTTTLDFQTKLFPFFQIKGNRFTLKVSHLGESEENFRFMFGKTDRSIWKIETQSGMGTFYGSEASSSSGCVLKFEDVSFPYIIGQSEWDKTIFGKTTDSSATTNVLGIVLGCVFGFIALAAIIAGIVVAVICIRKKKNNNNGGNEV